MTTVTTQIISLQESLNQYLSSINNSSSRQEQQLYSNFGKTLGVSVSAISYQGSLGMTTESLNAASNTLSASQTVSVEPYANGTSAFNESLGKYMVRTSGGSLNVRSGPGLNYDIIDSLVNGAELELLEEFSVGHDVGAEWDPIGWCYIRYYKGTTSATGYVSGEYIVPYSEETTDTTGTTDYTGGTAVVGGDTIVPSPAAETTTSTVGSGKQSVPMSQVQSWSSFAPTYIDYTATPEEITTVWPPEMFPEDPRLNFRMQNYTRASMSVTTNNNGKLAVYNFSFLIGPSAFTENKTNSVVPVRTGGGFFVLRNGPELTRLILSGYLLDSAQADERRTFLQHYYNAHLVDKVNAFHEYFNEARLELDVSGYKYSCILTDLQLSQSSDMMFAYKYHMGLLVLHQEPSIAVVTPTGLSTQQQLATVWEVFTPTVALTTILQLGIMLGGF